MKSKLLCIFLIIFYVSNCAVAADDYFRASATYYRSGWEPTGIENVNYETTGLNAVVAELDFTPMIETFDAPISFFPKFKYMWTPENEAEQKELLERVESLEGENALKRLFVDWPIIPLGELSNVSITYDKAAFLASLTTERDLNYIKFGGDVTQLKSGDYLSQLVEFEKSTVIWIQEVPTNQLQENRIVVGGGYFMVKYQKPYSLTVKGESVSDDVFDTKFEASGFAFLIRNYWWKDDDGSELYFGLLAQYGRAEITYSDDETVAELLDETETPTFMGLNAEVFLRQGISESISFTAELGYDYYDFQVGVESPDGTVMSSKYVGDLDINLDSVFFFRAGIVYSI